MDFPLQFPDSHILNHRIIVASFEEKGSQSAQGDRNVAFFVVYQWVRCAASFGHNQSNIFSVNYC